MANYIDTLGSEANAAEIVAEAERQGITVSEWLAETIIELDRANPWAGYDKVSNDDLDEMARQIENEAA